MPPGTYAVKFEDGSIPISSRIASPSNRGEDDTRDSDGIAAYSAEMSLEKTVILGIALPRAENMQTSLYESKYHDSGFCESGHELPMTGGPGTTDFRVVGSILLIGAAVLLITKKRVSAAR